MKRLIGLLLVGFSLSLCADVLEIGDEVPDMCWKDAESQDLCLNFFALRVRVLLYNTGWCPDCNVEMEELVPHLKEFAEKPVLFLSLSASGNTSSAPPDSEFLKEWTLKHQIPFPVLASPKDPGKKFFEPPYHIPAVVIVGSDNRVFYKEVEPPIEMLLQKVNEALTAPLPGWSSN